MGNEINRCQRLFRLVGIMLLVSVIFSESVKFKRKENLKYLVVHIDLKGAPLKLSHITNLLPEFRKMAVNGLLLDYGDIFPYGDQLLPIRSGNAYSGEELSQFIENATKWGFEIIPLVETFGNMDFVLEHDEFYKLRESPTSTDSICPSKEESGTILRDLLEQVIIFHNKIAPLKFFHIGCGEVQHINECIYCRERDLRTVDIFERHVVKIYSYVQAISANTEILIWDNVLLRENLTTPLGIPIQPVVQYCGDSPPKVKGLQKYQTHYETVWAASPFKGVDGMTATFPDLSKRYIKHYRWMQNINQFILEDFFHFSGIIITGCSQYAHSQKLCELFTASIPSLYLHLLIVEAFNMQIYKSYDLEKQRESRIRKYVLKRLKDELHCEIKDDEIDKRYFLYCNYNGSEINRGLVELSTEFEARRDLSKTVNQLVTSISQYYDEGVANNYVNQIIDLMIKAYQQKYPRPKQRRTKRPVTRVDLSNLGDIKQRQKIIKMYLERLRTTPAYEFA